MSNCSKKAAYPLAPLTSAATKKVKSFNFEEGVDGTDLRAVFVHAFPGGSDNGMECGGPVVIDDFGDVFGLLLALTSDGFPPSEMESYADDLKREISLVDGVARIDLWGVRARRIYLDVHQSRLEELGIAQAIWILEVENFGPFLVESDLEGNSLFERENRKTAAGVAKAFEGLGEPALKRYGETTAREDEVV